MHFIRRWFNRLKVKLDYIKLLWYLHKQIVVALYKAVRKHGNIVVGLGWVERENEDDEGKVSTNITYYNMRLYDVYHAFYHMHKRYYDELKKVHEGRPTQVDDHTGRWFKYSVNLEVESEDEDTVASPREL